MCPTMSESTRAAYEFPSARAFEEKLTSLIREVTVELMCLDTVDEKAKFISDYVGCVKETQCLLSRIKEMTGLFFTGEERELAFDSLIDRAKCGWQLRYPDHARTSMLDRLFIVQWWCYLSQNSKIRPYMPMNWESVYIPSPLEFDNTTMQATDEQSVSADSQATKRPCQVLVPSLYARPSDEMVVKALVMIQDKAYIVPGGVQVDNVQENNVGCGKALDPIGTESIDNRKGYAPEAHETRQETAAAGSTHIAHPVDMTDASEQKGSASTPVPNARIRAFGANFPVAARRPDISICNDEKAIQGHIAPVPNNKSPVASHNLKVPSAITGVGYGSNSIAVSNQGSTSREGHFEAYYAAEDNGTNTSFITIHSATRESTEGGHDSRRAKFYTEQGYDLNMANDDVVGMNRANQPLSTRASSPVQQVPIPMDNCFASAYNKPEHKFGSPSAFPGGSNTVKTFPPNTGGSAGPFSKGVDDRQTVFPGQGPTVGVDAFRRYDQDKWSGNLKGFRDPSNEESMISRTSLPTATWSTSHFPPSGFDNTLHARLKGGGYGEENTMGRRESNPNDSNGDDMDM